ncbi:hypothetical protein BJ742DRAFT_681691 [Cladochytrium replicatum]|nr:hypothetical protein BJ742DRAFT_681691 [Cladochytrium replicatum]
MATPSTTLFIGTIIHSTAVHAPLEILTPGALAVDSSSGVITLFKELPQDAPVDESTVNALIAEMDCTNVTVRRLHEDQFIIPGFLDTHIHSPQFTYTGTGLDLPLLQWLETYTFPREQAFEEPQYARLAYPAVVSRTLRCGTTTACYYATLHLEASRILVDVLLEHGQRALVGKVNMDRNSPESYSETTEQAKLDTIAFVDYVESKSPEGLLRPCLTPRFVPSCTPDLMAFLGELASKRDLAIQSHLSESKAEVEWVRNLHPYDGITPIPETSGSEWSYTGVYKHFGLLTSKTVMAHCIHLTPHERTLIRTTNAGIAHCPASNFQLQSGILDVRQLFSEGITKVGLGTDCAGGPSPSMLDAMRNALVATKTVGIMKGVGSGYRALTLDEVFYLATLGGARVLGVEGQVGSFGVGKEFDAILVDLGTQMMEEVPQHGHRTVPRFDHDDARSMFEKFVHLGDDRNMAEVYVRGRLVSTPPLYNK